MAERNGRAHRGFAAMDPDQQRRIASAGGRAAHERGSAHEFTADEAREAGRKGGRTVSANRAHMALIGRRGGMARGQTTPREPDAQESAMSAGSASSTSPEPTT